MSDFVFKNRSDTNPTGCFPFLYRITGKQSIERLQPLIESFKNKWLIPINPETVSIPLDFVWETTCEKEWKSSHATAKIINRLNNTGIIESKSNLAYLQLRMKCTTLTTYVARNNNELIEWIHRHYSSQDTSSVTSTEDWWAIKASAGNGGKDIWIINKENYLSTIDSLPKQTDEEYVIQRYNSFVILDYSDLIVFFLFSFSLCLLL
jgi:hypothetical protein